MKTFHCEKVTGHTAAILEEINCYDLRWFAMLLEAQNRRKMAHFIAPCGRAFSLIVKLESAFRLTAAGKNAKGNKETAMY